VEARAPVEGRQEGGGAQTRKANARKRTGGGAQRPREEGRYGPPRALAPKARRYLVRTLPGALGRRPPPPPPPPPHPPQK